MAGTFYSGIPWQCDDFPQLCCSLTLTWCGSMGKNGTDNADTFFMVSCLYYTIAVYNKVIIVALILPCYFNQPGLSSSAGNEWVYYKHRPRIEMSYLEGVLIQQKPTS